MTEYIKREDAMDAVLDVYYNTPDIDLNGERLETAILELVKEGILANDGWDYVEDFVDVFSIDKKNPRIEVKIVEPEGKGA